jgi:rfaE bifunctional protein nucleotidyltransferase chain/domain
MTAARARDKVLSLDRLVRRLASIRRNGESVVFTNGCFDLLHLGHIRSLEEASRLGDRMIVAINSDASIRRAKGPTRPVVSARQRMELVAALACVDWVVGFSADTPLRLIRRLRPDVLAKGGDWALEEIVGADLIQSWGGRVSRLRVVPGERSTDLIERIRKNPASKIR